jgi:PAS domain S-box-containing protein
MFAEEVLGTMTAGYGLDDRVAEELSLVAHCEVNLVCSDGRLCGSSLDAAARSSLVEMLARDRARLGQMDERPQVRGIGAASYVSGVYPLLPDSGRRDSGQLILMQAWQPTEEAIARMRNSLLGVSLVTLAIALGGSLLFSQWLTRPLRKLADVANAIAAGRETGRVPVDGPAEARLMATAFNDMTHTLRHWYHEASSRSEQLQDAYDRFRAVTESANDAIVSVDGDGRIVFWNHRATLVFGYTAQEALGRTFTMLIPERHLQHGDDLRRSLADGEAQWIGKTVEVVGRTCDGRETPLELSLSTWKGGQDVFYTGIIRDITDRKRAEQILHEREEQLRQSQKMEAIGRLAGGIAHDFNNLLTAILGYTDFLLQDVPGPSKGDVEGIHRAGRSAAALTRQLLAFSRRQVLLPVVLDLNATIAGTEKLLRRLIGEDVELALTLEPSLPPVTADPGQIEQVVLNLAVNARDAMPDGGRLTIATSAGAIGADTMRDGMPVKAGPYVVITVTDTGCGMSDEVRSRIFEPFFTTKGVGRGTGLGLATVYGIVQQSNGYIDVLSAPGRGTTFRIGLPATSGPAAEVVVPDERPARMLRGSETILLVEDNESVRGFAVEALGRAGYQVLEAENGEHGLRLAAETGQRIDLVITDIVMPLMGGRDLAARLRSVRPDLKVIFTSGYTDDEIVRQDVLQTGAFLQKPFTADALGRLVREVMDHGPS